MSLTFCLCHMVYGTTRKEYGILYLCLYLYCRIGIFTVFLYINIVILFYISIVYNKAIYIYLFPFLMFHLNFLAQVVPLTITASFLSAKVWQPRQTPNTSRCSPYRRRFFAADFRNQRLGILQKFSTDCLAYCLIGLPSSKARKKA